MLEEGVHCGLKDNFYTDSSSYSGMESKKRIQERTNKGSYQHSVYYCGLCVHFTYFFIDKQCGGTYIQCAGRLYCGIDRGGNCI